MFIEYLFRDPHSYFMRIFIVTFSVCCHEYAHARMALWQGDGTAADAGHLTLSPLKQMGGLSLIMLFVLGITWGAVPVNPSQMKHRYSNALVSFAGPMMNITLFTIFTFFLALALSLKANEPALEMLAKISVINFVLFALNMMPAPMLDGWKVYSYFFPKINTHNSEFGSGLTLIIFLLVIFSIDLLFRAGQFMMLNMTGLFSSILIFSGIGY